MMDNARTVLKERFGFEDWRAGQEVVVTRLLSGQSAAAIFPTGSGKSLCYQLPALLLEGLTLVVSPLIALMKDQLDALESRGIPAARLDSSLTADAYREVMNALRSGTLKLLYVAPERFNNERFRRGIEGVRISLLAIDEAHCVSEWGHNFRPDYLKLAHFAKACGAERVLALTATATPKVVDDIRTVFDIEKDAVVRTGFYRPNLTLLIDGAAADERDALLIQKLKRRPSGPTIVYVTQQRTAEALAERIRDAGRASKAYHAGMKPEDRTRVQDWFMASDTAVVVATIAFGMGVDKENIRYVYHHNLPKSLENYAQEIGRAGRDGAPAECQMFVCADDLLILENFAYGDTPTRTAIADLMADLFGRDRDFDVSYYALSHRHDIKILVVRTLMTYLELDGYLRGGTPFYSRYRFRPLATSNEILGRFEGERRLFLQKIFCCAVKAKKWFDIDVDATASRIACDRSRIVKALDYLSEQGLLELSAQGVRNAYTRLKSPDNMDDLVTSLYRKAVDRENGEIKRLHQVMALAHHDGCLVAHLSNHFGEPLDNPCGHCSWCLGEPRREIHTRGVPAIDETALGEALDILKSRPDIFREPRDIARFLAGVTSPKTTRAKLTSENLFGTMADIPFPTLLQAVTDAAMISDRKDGAADV